MVANRRRNVSRQQDSRLRKNTASDRFESALKFVDMIQWAEMHPVIPSESESKRRIDKSCGVVLDRGLNEDSGDVSHHSAMIYTQ